MSSSHWKATKTKTAPDVSTVSKPGWTTYETYTKNSHKYNKEAEPYAEVWAAQSTRSKMQNLLVIRCTMLGPFLYGIQTYCPAALKEAISGSLLPENGLWPVFYEYDDQKKLESFTMVVEYALRALESDPFFIPFTLTDYGMNKVEAEASCIGYFQYLCNDLKESIPLPELRTYVRVVRIQLKHVIITMRTEGAHYIIDIFKKKQTEHVNITEAIKERGNKNTRELKYRAAIADYTRALKLSPYSETLYCNRAMCYLKCQDFWLACIDSQRAYVLKPDYDKAYYRCTDAWLHMGELRYAAIISQMAAKICRFSSDLVKQSKEIKEIWVKAKLGHKDMGFVYKQSDLDKGFPEVFTEPEMQCAECVSQAERLGLIYDGLPRVTLFKGPHNPHAEEIQAMKEWLALQGKKDKEKTLAITAGGETHTKEKGTVEIKTKLTKKQRTKAAKKEQMDKAALTKKEGFRYCQPVDTKAIKRVFRTLFEMDKCEKEGRRFNEDDVDLSNLSTPSVRTYCDMSLPDGRKMYFEALKPDGYVSIRIERQPDEDKD